MSMTDKVIEHDGRWDINFVREPKLGSGFIKYDLVALRVIKEKHPEAWNGLKKAIDMVDLGAV